MKIKQHNETKSKFVALLFRMLFIALDNSDDSKPDRNGEDRFMKKMSDVYRDQDFIVFDIGANLGEYTSTLLQGGFKSFTAHLFEPQPACIQILEKQFSQQPAIHINHFGLSDTDHTAPLYSDNDLSPVASLYNRDLSSHNRTMKNTGEIQLKRGEDYIKNQGVTHISLLKIDVEGHELGVLRGLGDFLQPENIDFIQFEYGGANLDSKTTLKELHDLLSSRGFILCKLMRRNLEIRPFVPYLENFRYQNWIAVAPNLVKSL